MSFVYVVEGLSNASSPGPSPQSQSPLVPPGVLTSDLSMRSPAAAAPHPVASSSTTAEMRLVDVVSALSRLEVQMTKDIDAVRHAQASATLRGILGVSDITAREGRDGTNNGHNAAKGSRVTAAEIDVPNSAFLFEDKTAAGETEGDDDDGARSEFGIELESQGEMSSFRSSVAPPLGPFARGGSHQNASYQQAAYAVSVSAPPSTIPPRILALRAAQR